MACSQDDDSLDVDDFDPDSDCEGALDLKGADVRYQGEDGSDNTGISGTLAGDVDGDGDQDVVIGSTGDDEQGNAAGAVYVLLDTQEGTVDLGQADVKLLGGHAGDRAGIAVASGCDLDGDGIDDIVVGAAESGDETGSVHVVSGGPSMETQLSHAATVLTGSQPGERAGSAVSCGLDVNLDGAQDLVVGSPYAVNPDEAQTGAAYLIYGPLPGGSYSLDEIAVVIYGQEQDDWMGSSVSIAGDVNGDGYGDVLVGAPGCELEGGGSGTVFLFHGPVASQPELSAADATIRNANEQGCLGEVSSAGDTNDDGFDDVLVGDVCSLAAYLFLGPISSTATAEDADAVFLGERAGDGFGSVVSLAGDTNGDGMDDMLIGASSESCNGVLAGSAYEIHGPVLGMVDVSQASTKYVGEHTSCRAGAVVANDGDVNGDGIDDLFIGAPWIKTAYLVFGR